MAVKARLTTQMPWVGTPDQADVINHLAETADLSKAKVVRDAVDYVFGLVNGNLAEGDTVEAAVARGQALLAGRSPHAATTPA